MRDGMATGRATARLGRILVLLAALLAGEGSAGVVRLDVASREVVQRAPGTVAYERITGIAHLVADPADRANAAVVDLEAAPRNQEGLVEYSTEFELMRPVDAAAGNRRLLYFVCNRGNRHGEGFFNRDLDHNWLMSNGYSYLWSGWSGDVAPHERRLNITVPRARGTDGPIRGPVVAEVVNYADRPVPALPLTWGGSIPPIPVEDAETTAELVRRRYPWDEPEKVASWAFARFENGEQVADRRYLHVEGGLEPGWLYQLTYTAQDPLVSGLGMTGIRDLVSYLRYGGEAGATESPLSGAVDRAYAWGHSQSGRLLLHFVWQGFNADASARVVFDGVMPNCPGAGKGQFNSRFAQSTRHGSHIEDRLYPVDFFPLAFEHQTDPVTGESGHALGAALTRHGVPKVMVLNSSTDYWTRAASLLHTDVAGTRDAVLHPDVRVYLLAGIAHTDGRAGIVGRALLTALDRWVTDGVAPPASRVPRIDDGTLVDLAAWQDRFPDVPGLLRPRSFYRPTRLDPGERWEESGIADRVPPGAGAEFCALVPQVDDDGNELAGIRLPEIAVPLATHCGWRMRNPSFSMSLSRNAGRVWPFARSESERRASGDDRASIAERHGDRETYLAEVRACLDGLREDRLLLPADHRRLLEAAEIRAGLLDGLVPLRELAAAGSLAEAAARIDRVRRAELEWYYGSGVGRVLNGLGYEDLARGALESAERLFRINTLLYPDDGNAWDSLAECALEQGRQEDARRFYRRALDLDPGNDNARKMLGRLDDAARPSTIGDPMGYLEVLAGDAMEGRGLGQEGLDRALDYAERRMADLGLEPAFIDSLGRSTYRQPVAVDRLRFGAGTTARLSVDGAVRELHHGHEMMVARAGERVGRVAGTVVDAGYGIHEPDLGHDDLAGLDLEGKWAVVREGRPPGLSGEMYELYGTIDRGGDRIIDALADAGAVGVLIAIPGLNDEMWEMVVDAHASGVFVATRDYMGGAQSDTPFPLVVPSPRTTEALLSGGADFSLQVEVERERVVSYNLGGIVRGAVRPSEVVVFSAHIDHLGIVDGEIHNGANDDASGCAAVLAAVPALQAAGLDRSVACILFTGEEAGHFGSLEFMTRGLHGSIHSSLNLEHVGRAGDGTFLATADRALLPLVEDTVRRRGGLRSAELDPEGRIVRGSDSFSFHLYGVPLVIMGGGGFPEYHGPEDDVGLIDSTLLRRSVDLSLDLISGLANAGD